MISFHDNNISEIDNLGDNVSNNSHIDLLKEPAEDRRLRPVSEDQSGSSIDDVEKSHEHIRKLMEDTEELHSDEYVEIDENRGPSKVVGAIGERANKQMTYNQTPA